ncbi:MAG: TrmH family RNA methyltransferase [Flavobacteriaceae bacterium]
MRKWKNDELNRKTVSEFKAAPKTPIIVILDNIRSLNNIGSVFRTADAFLIQKIYLCGITARPPHKDIQKTALGATDAVNWEYHKEALPLIHKLQNQKTAIFAIEQAEGAESLMAFTPKPNTTHAFVFGNEVRGVAQEIVDVADGVIEIPQEGTKHSLNIAVSAGIVLWDCYHKLHSSQLAQ